MNWFKKIFGKQKPIDWGDWVPPSERVVLMSSSQLMSIQDQLPLPQKLLGMMESDEWVHPGDNIMEEKIPFIDCKMDVLVSKEEMLRESWGILMEYEAEREFISAYRGTFVDAKYLPWLDVEKSVALMVNREIGDDHVILLDYRKDQNNPSVVGSDWGSIEKRMIYREIAPSFDTFIEMLYG